MEPHDTAGRDALVMRMLRSVQSFGDANDRMNLGMRGDMDMNGTDLAALRLLSIRDQQQRPVSPKQIAAHLRISTASTTKLIDRLVASGHVRRAPHPTDRRAVVIELTEAARAEFFRQFAVRLRAMRAAFDAFTDAELAAAARVVDAVSAAIDPGEA